MATSTSIYLPSTSSLDKTLTKYVKKSDVAANIISQSISGNTLSINSISSSAAAGSIASTVFRPILGPDEPDKCFIKRNEWSVPTGR